MLGDVYAERQKITHNTRLSFDQGSVNADYARHLLEVFGSLVNMGMYITNRLTPHMRTGKVYVSLMFKTLALPALNVFREMYYLPACGKGVKTLPADLAEHFTGVSLAY